MLFYLCNGQTGTQPTVPRSVRSHTRPFLLQNLPIFISDGLLMCCSACNYVDSCRLSWPSKARVIRRYHWYQKRGFREFPSKLAALSKLRPLDSTQHPARPGPRIRRHSKPLPSCAKRTIFLHNLQQLRPAPGQSLGEALPSHLSSLGIPCLPSPGFSLPWPGRMACHVIADLY